MATQTTTTANLALRRIYEAGFVETFNQELIAWSRFQRVKRTITGELYQFQIKATRNWGMGPRAELGTLPTPGSVGWKAGRLLPVYYYHGFRISGQTVSRMAHGGSAAAINALVQESDDIRRGMSKMLNWHTYGNTPSNWEGLHASGGTFNGVTGTGGLAKVTVVNTTTTCTVDDVNRLEVNGEYTVAAADGTGADTLTVTGINEQTKLVTYTPGRTLLVNDLFYLTGSEPGGASIGRAICSLPQILTNDTSIDYAMNRGNETFWVCQTIDGSAGLHPQMFLKAKHLARKAAGGNINLCLLSLGQWRAVHGMIFGFAPTGTTGAIAGMRVTVPHGAARVQMAVDNFEYAGIEFLADPNCPDSTIFLLDTSTWAVVENEPIHFIPVSTDDARTGSYLQWQGSTDEWVGRAKWYGNLECNNVPANVTITNVPAPTI